MSATKHQRLAGILFIVGAVLINIPYTMLITGFDHPTFFEGLPEPYSLGIRKVEQV